MEEDVSKIVKELNEAIFHSSVSEHNYITYLEHIQTPIGDYVKYAGHYLWDSENDYRCYKVDPTTGEELDELEDLKERLLSEIIVIEHVLRESLKAMRKTK